MSSEKTIYTLTLHETLVISEKQQYMTYVRRVPGGWIYVIRNYNNCNTTSTFVPFNNEFQ